MLRKLHNHVFPQRNIITWITLIILVICCVVIPYYILRMRDVAREELLYSTAQTLKMAETSINHVMDGIENASNILFANSNLQSALSDKSGMYKTQEEFEEERDIQSAFQEVRAIEDIFKIRLFVSDDKIYAREHVNYFPISEACEEAWYISAKQNGKVIWQGTYLKEYLGEPATYVMSCNRIIRNLKKYDQILGVLAIDVEERDIYQLLSDIELPGGESLLIIDGDGMIISAQDKEKIGTAFPAAKQIPADEESGNFEYNGHMRQSISFQKIGKTEWRLIAQTPYRVYEGSEGERYSVSNVTVIFLTALLFLLSFVAFLYSNRMTKQIYEAEVREKDAQMKALQAQINPHFLYNILDTINWMAIKKNAEDISFMADSLATYFRLSLNKGKDIVSVADEIKLVQTYLDLQRHRVGDVFDAQYLIDKNVLEYTMPKLSLQPVVENALLHGIMNKSEGKGKIKISAEKKENNIVITVCDNGTGMSEEKIQEILSHANGGYGIYNVNERLKLFSGIHHSKSGINIHSEPETGTVVKLIFKAEK